MMPLSDVIMRVRNDGTGEVVVSGRSVPIVAPAVPDARRLGLAQIHAIATASGAPVRFRSYDPEGQWELLMDPSGHLSEARPAAVASAEPACETPTRDRWASQTPRYRQQLCRPHRPPPCPQLHPRRHPHRAPGRRPHHR